MSLLEYKQNAPLHDRVLAYELPYDYVYLRALEALNTFPEWVLEETDKEQGLIVLRNTEYGHLFDKDKQVARIRVKRIERKKTTVQLAVESQRIKEGGDFLNRIDELVLFRAKPASASTALESENQTQTSPPEA